MTGTFTVPGCRTESFIKIKILHLIARIVNIVPYFPLVLTMLESSLTVELASQSRA